MEIKQQQTALNIMLADDDIDDCIFFEGSLEKSPIATNFIAVHDGKQLMELLNREDYELPDVLFLDLNMPRKNGFECLSEIKLSEKLYRLPVIMFSTSNDQDVVNRLYENGAHYFIRKPAAIEQFEKIIHNTLTIIAQKNILQPSRENFVLGVEVKVD